MLLHAIPCYRILLHVMLFHVIVVLFSLHLFVFSMFAFFFIIIHCVVLYYFLSYYLEQHCMVLRCALSHVATCCCIFVALFLLQNFISVFHCLQYTCIPLYVIACYHKHYECVVLFFIEQRYTLNFFVYFIHSFIIIIIIISSNIFSLH